VAASSHWFRDILNADEEAWFDQRFGKSALDLMALVQRELPETVTVSDAFVCIRRINLPWEGTYISFEPGQRFTIADYGARVVRKWVEVQGLLCVPASVLAPPDPLAELDVSEPVPETVETSDPILSVPEVVEPEPVKTTKKAPEPEAPKKKRGGWPRKVM